MARKIILIYSFLSGLGLIYMLYASNIFIQSTQIQFSDAPNKPNMHQISVRAPYATFPVIVTVVPKATPQAGSPHVFSMGSYTGLGAYFWGKSVGYSNMYPSQGQYDDIPMDTFVKIDSQLNGTATPRVPEDKSILERCGTYIWVGSHKITPDDMQQKIEAWKL